MKNSRRKFLHDATLASLATTVAPSPFLTKTKFPGLQKLSDSAMVGIQMGPHSLCDEGIENVLDFLKQEAEINTIVLYSHTYYGDNTKPQQVLAKDHGTMPKDLSQRNLRHAWVQHDEKYFKDTQLRHESVTDQMEFHKRDIFEEIRRPATDRGMKVYARILEAGRKGLTSIKNYDKVFTIDLYGEMGSGPCWNNPDYRNWVLATMENLFGRYELDGIQYGAERTGALSDVLLKGKKPACFCEHCNKINRGRGIDPLRAKEGYTKLYEYMLGVRNGTADRTETVMTNIWKYLQKYPEVLSWNYYWFQADEEINKEIYLRIKAMRPEAVVGRHVDHQRSSWDPFYRSAVGYAQMAEYADFIKPILYHDIYGPRLRWWVIEEWQKYMFNDMSKEQTLSYLYQTMGYSPEARVPLNKLAKEGMGPEYVFDEIKRCVNSVDDDTEVVSGIGLDVMWHGRNGIPQPNPSDPLKLQKAIYKSIEAGATGILASREYDEMRFSSLRAFGEAIRQVK